jgi:hypothetical protein
VSTEIGSRSAGAGRFNHKLLSGDFAHLAAGLRVR